jgi:hypothetical protein
LLQIEDSPEHVNGFLPEPALYRLESATTSFADSSSKVTKTRTRDLIDDEDDEERTATAPSDGENSNEIFI